MEELVSTVLGLIVVFVTIFLSIATQKRKKRDDAWRAPQGVRPKSPPEASVYKRYMSEQAGALEIHENPVYTPHLGAYAGESHKSDYAPHLEAHEGESHESGYTPHLGAHAGESHMSDYAPNLGIHEGESLYSARVRTSLSEDEPDGAEGQPITMFSIEDMRAAVIMREILDRPRALRPRGAYGYRR